MTGGKPHFVNETGAEIYLVSCGQKRDEEIDLVEAALAFALLSDPSLKIAEYRKSIDFMAEELRLAFQTICASDNSDNVHVQAKALKQVIVETHGYVGNENHYDDLQNINLCRVMDTRTGLPITLCILAIGLCRAQGWDASGINFPGHFIMRLEKDGERLMIDPFQACKILEAKDLRLILKKIMGEYAELSVNYYDSCTNREILLRLQNNLKYRLIDQEDYKEALGVIDKMQWVAPDDYRIFLDKAVLLARLEQPKAAIDNLERYLAKVKDPYDKAEAESFLYQLRQQLN